MWNARHADSAGTGFVLVGNGSHTHAALVHGDHVRINNLAAQRRLVMSGMARMSGELEIFEPIVSLNPVDVMDHLVRQEPTTQLLFHYRSMLKKSAAIVHGDSAISRVSDAASSSSAPVVRCERVTPSAKFTQMSSAHPMPVNLSASPCSDSLESST
jgi:hypothetical protein